MLMVDSSFSNKAIVAGDSACQTALCVTIAAHLTWRWCGSQVRWVGRSLVVVPDVVLRGSEQRHQVMAVVGSAARLPGPDQATVARLAHQRAAVPVPAFRLKGRRSMNSTEYEVLVGRGPLVIQVEANRGKFGVLGRQQEQHVRARDVEPLGRNGH